MPKPLTIKVPPGQAKKLADAVRLVRAHYGPILAVWRTLPERRREMVLAHSPQLARLLEGVV